MNSYPPELLAQLAPVMFVAGLDAPVHPQQNSEASAPPPAKTQDFNLLILRLREALQAQRKVAVWQPEKNKSFQVILTDRDVRFPPRKLIPPEDPQFSAAHSPLSPLTPSSPLYPDGLIAPIWIRKHTTLVPSVYVLFLRIFEFPPQSSISPLDAPDNDRERQRELEERKRDAELAADVAQRKKGTNERGIKLTVVLMASRRMLDDPTLDARLTFIRRQSGLDSRAALFVLSPVSPAELGDFVKSLQQALYEPALEYYTAHSKRVRRKRNRHSQASSYPNVVPLGGSVNITRPLRPEGWTVRYEYKMACFAEFRGEDEVALKHYQDAHGMLVVMFGSTAILPPRTKRWAEAKVLADCINVKISKLYLYNNEHALALSHHNSHIRKFAEFSRGWGIGEETFEFWSWMARQHRILAELLEQGTRSTLTIPVHKPIPPSATNATLAVSQIQNSTTQRGVTVANALEIESMRSLGINPSYALQHPGFYYYMAAKCTEMRRQRFLAIFEAELTQQSVLSSPGFANEKKVDHLTIILELYTKAYELFKKYTAVDPQNPTQGRLTLWIAYRIAQTYFDSGKFDMAIRFFERIAKTYRRERWGSMLRPLLSTWYACAQQLGDVELSVRLLVEMLGHDATGSDDLNCVEEDLLAVLKGTVPSSDNVLVVDLSESQPIFDSNVVFWASEVKVNEPAAFQLSLTAPTGLAISSLPFSSLAIYFSHRNAPVIVRHVASDTTSQSLYSRVNLGHVKVSETIQELSANLHWRLGSCIIFSGTVSSDIPTTLRITKLVLTITESTWKVEIPFNPCGSHHGLSPTAKWLSSVDSPQFVPIKREDSSFVNVRHRSHNLVISLVHQSPAYLDEDYPITIEITNADSRELDVVIDVLLQPTEIDDAINMIALDDKRSSGFIKGIPFGVLAPGISVVKTLYLRSTGAAGDRMVDISIQSRSKDLSDGPAVDDPELQDITEILRTIVVPTVDPIRVTQTIAYRRALTEWPGLADLQTFDFDFWDDRQGGEALVNTTMECTGPWGLEVESIKFENQDHKTAKIVDSSVDDEDGDLPSEYLPGDELAHFCRISLAPTEDQDLEKEAISGPGKYLVNWRRIRQNGERGPISTTIVSLPSLRPPVDGLVALLTVPPAATLHLPICLTLTIRNHHPTRSANVVIQLELDATDSFVVAGLRSGQVPVLMPGAEERLTWSLIPIECGYVKIPRINVYDRRRTITSEGEPNANMETKGEVVKIIDVRLEGQGARDTAEFSRDGANLERPIGLGTILVLP